MPEARHLRVVDEHGELLEECPTCVGYQHTIRSQASTIGKLKSELRPDENHDLFPAAKRLHDFWREACHHPRSKFSVERFKECKARLDEYGEAMCRRAIEGAAYDAYVTTRKNGSAKRHDGWELIFRHDKFEEFCNRAPYHLPDPEKVHVLANALLHLNPEWETDRAVAEAQSRLGGSCSVPDTGYASGDGLESDAPAT